MENRNHEMKRLRDEGMTLQAIGSKFGITRERVRQIVGNEEICTSDYAPRKGRGPCLTQYGPKTVETFAAYLNSGSNAARAAASLGLSNSALSARLRMIREHTGLDLRLYFDQQKLLRCYLERGLVRVTDGKVEVVGSDSAA